MESATSGATRLGWILAAYLEYGLVRRTARGVPGSMLISVIANGTSSLS